MPVRGCQHNSKTYTAVVCIRNDAIPLRDRAKKIPVVMASSAEPPFFARAGIWCAVAGYGVDLVDTGVLAPLPDVTAHIIEAELVWGL
jgi:hypothetical protein